MDNIIFNATGISSPTSPNKSPFLLLIAEYPHAPTTTILRIDFANSTIERGSKGLNILFAF